MSKKSKKKKKRVNLKKEKYAQFRKDKPSAMDFSTPDLTPEQVKQKQEDEMKINRFLRFNKNPPTKEVNARKERSKR